MIINDLVYYKIDIKNNDTFPIKNVYIDISTIIEDFDNSFELYTVNGNILKYSYVANNYECHNFNTVFPFGNSKSWLTSVNGFPTTICVTLPVYLNPSETMTILAYNSDTDTSLNGDDIFEFYYDFNNDAIFDSKFHSYNVENYTLDNGTLIVPAQPLTISNNIITSKNTFSYNNNDVFQLMVRWRLNELYTTDSSYIGLIKSRLGVNYESYKYLFNTTNTACKINSTKIDSGYTSLSWNYGIYTFRPSQFYMKDTFFGIKTQAMTFNAYGNYYICVNHAKPNQNTANTNTVVYDFIAKTAFPIIAPTIAIRKKTKYHETYTPNIKTVISSPAIDLNEITDFNYISISAEEYSNAYIRFAFTFDDKQTWVVYNQSTEAWEQIETNEIIATNNGNFDSINSKGMTLETVKNLTKSQFTLATNQFGFSNFYIMACYKSDLQDTVVNRDIYEFDMSLLTAEEFAINLSFKQLELAYTGTITINNSVTGLDYVDFPFRVNIASYLNKNGENIKLVDSLTFEDIPFTYEYTNGVCYSSDKYAEPQESKTGYIWMRCSINDGATRQIYVLNNVDNNASDGYDVFDKYANFTTGISDFFTVDTDAQLDITKSGITFKNKRGMYGIFDDTFDSNDYIVEASSSINTAIQNSTVYGTRLTVSNITNIPDTGTVNNFVTSIYTTPNPYSNYILKYDSRSIIQSPAQTNLFEKYGIVLNKQGDSIKIFKDDAQYYTTTYGTFSAGIDKVRFGYLNDGDDSENLITPITYKWFRIRKYAENLPAISISNEFESSVLIKTNNNTNFKFNNDFFKSVVSATTHEIKPENTDIRYLFSFNGAKTWCKWTTDEKLFPNGWMHRYKITIDKNRLPNDLTDFKLPVLISNSCGTGNQDCTHIFDTLRTPQYYTFFDNCNGVIANNWNISSDDGCLCEYNDSKLKLSVVNDLDENNAVNATSVLSYETDGESVLIFDWTPASENSFYSTDSDTTFSMVSIIQSSGADFSTYGKVPNFNVDSLAFMGIKLLSTKQNFIEVVAKINGVETNDYNSSWEFPLENNENNTYTIKLIINWKNYTLKLYINGIQCSNIMNFNPRIKHIIGDLFKTNLNWHCFYKNGIQSFSNILIYTNNGDAPLGIKYLDTNKFKLNAENLIGTQYPVEIVNFDCNTRTALILVTIDGLSKVNDTEFYLYYDKYNKNNQLVSINNSYVFNNYEYIKSYQYSTSPTTVSRWAEIPIDYISEIGNVEGEFSNKTTCDFSSNMDNTIDVAIYMSTNDITKTPCVNGFDINCVYNKIDTIAKILGVSVYYDNQYGENVPNIPQNINFYKIDTDDFAGFYRIKNIIGKVIFNY